MENHTSTIDPTLLPRTIRAIKTLESRKTAIAQKHTERIKRLIKFQDQLVAANFEEVGLMMEHTFTPPPEILRLIDTPEEGL